MCKKYAIYLLFTLVASFVWPSSAYGQKCRLKCGVSAEGHTTYREVFEYDYVSDKPAFPGGESRFVKFVNETRVYPTDAYNDGIQGRVVCSFVVNDDGKIGHIEVLKGVYPSLNMEAIRILSMMPCWIPGKIDGKEVPVRVIRAIPFRK